MLVDLDFQAPEIMQRRDKGLYVPLSWTFREILTSRGWWEFFTEWPEFASSDAGERIGTYVLLSKAGHMFPEYGSCDSPEQFMESDVGRCVTESPWPLLVTFVYMTKRDNPGYRWHKNGPYVGLLETQSEYLGEEPAVDSIWQYHVFRRNDKVQPSSKEG